MHLYRPENGTFNEWKKISSPRIIVREGETGKITQETSTEKTFIEVVAKEGEIQNHKGIMMNFVVGYIGQDGNRTIAKSNIIRIDFFPKINRLQSIIVS